MNLQNFCKRLANGRLSHTNLIEAVEGGFDVKSSFRIKVINAINEGLVRLYTRFILNEKDVVIMLRDHIVSYYLDSLYSETLYPQDGVEIPYILDLPGEVFTNDVIKILNVYDHYGQLLPLNDINNSKSLFSPKYNMLQVPKPVTGELINVTYQAKHIELSIDEPLEEIILNDSLMGALEAYVAYLIFSDINSDDAKIKSDKQFLLYNQICNEVRDTDVISNSVSTTKSKFNERGWT
jgi:hypothetical protein